MSHTKFIMLWLYLYFNMTAQPTLNVFILQILCKKRRCYSPCSTDQCHVGSLWQKSQQTGFPRSVLGPWDFTSLVVEGSSLCHKLLAWKEKKQCTNKSSTSGSSLLFPFWATWESRVKKWVKIKPFTADSGISRFEIEIDFLQVLKVSFVI